MERTRNTIDLTTESSANTLPTEGLTTSNNLLGAVRTGGNSEVSSAQQLWISNMAPFPLAELEPFLRAVLMHLCTVDLDGSFTFEVIVKLVHIFVDSLHSLITIFLVVFNRSQTKCYPATLPQLSSP